MEQRVRADARMEGGSGTGQPLHDFRNGGHIYPRSPSAPQRFARRRAMNMSVRQRTAIRRSTSHPAEGRRMQLVRHLVPALVAGLFWAVPFGAQETTGAV